MQRTLPQANAIKKISVQRGYDVSPYTLVSFGGAGGQHACMVRNLLPLLHPRVQMTLKSDARGRLMNTAFGRDRARQTHATVLGFAGLSLWDLGFR